MLNLKPNFDQTDDFYAALIHAHKGLTDAESEALNARLILIFANHIGQKDVLIAALQTAAKP